MLDPAGDAKHTGRKIDDSFERGITLQCAQEVKTILEERHPSTVRVILTRFPGETLQPQQNAIFANRLDVQLYINLHFYYEPDKRPQWYLYQFSYGLPAPMLPTQQLTFYPYDRAYLLNSSTTTAWARMIKETLEHLPHRWFDLQGVFKLPFKPLIGIISPAIAFEIGLQTKDDWMKYSKIIAEIVEPIIRSITL